MKLTYLHRMQGRKILQKWATHRPESPNANGESSQSSAMNRQDSYLSVEAWLNMVKAGKPERDHLQVWYRKHGSSEVAEAGGEPEELKEFRQDAERWAALQAFHLDLQKV